MDGFRATPLDSADIIAALVAVDAAVGELFTGDVTEDAPTAHLLGEVELTWQAVDVEAYGGTPALDRRLLLSGTFRGERRDAIFAGADRVREQRVVLANLSIAWARLTANIQPEMKAASARLTPGRLFILPTGDGGLTVQGSLTLEVFGRFSEVE